MGSRNTSVRTGRQKVSQVTDNTRPAGLSTLVPVRLFRDFNGKTAGSFRTNPTAAAVVRTKNHNGTSQFGQLSWHQALGLEEYGHGNYGSPVYDTGSGEFTTGQYANAGAVGGSFASADARLVNDVSIVTDTGVLVLDTKQSRDGRYTYVLSVAPNVTASIYFSVYDNVSGVRITTTGVTDSFGHIVGAARIPSFPAVSAWGSIAVVDDTTTQDATHHMAYNSCMFVVQFVLNAGGGNFEGSHAVFRFDYVTSVVDEMYSAGTVTDFTTTNPGTNAWAEIQLVPQVGSTLQALLGYRKTVTGASPDAGVPNFEMWTTFVAGDSPTSGPTAISGTSFDIDFGQPPTTAVSMRGEPSIGRRFYLYMVQTGSANLTWVVLNPATFFSAGAPDQPFNVFGFPSGTTYVATKASPLPPAFIDSSGHAHMFVAFVYKNTTSNVTNVQCFMHTTVTTGSDTTPSLGSNPPGITVATASGAAQPTAAVGVTIASDPASFVAAAAAVYLHPGSNTYTLTEIGFTDPTDMTKIFPQAVITAAGSTNTALNTLPSSNKGSFAYGSANWDFSAVQDKNDIQSLAFVNGTNTQVFLRVTTPFAAIALFWDADVYENLPNPTDVNTNGRVTTFYARATGANLVAYNAGVRVYTYSPGGYTTTTGSNAVDLSGSFVSATAPTLNPTAASLETTPAFTHPVAAESTTFVATMADEFTFNVSSWGGGLPILSNEIQAGMTIALQNPFTSLTSIGRYTITSVAYDAVNRTITQITVAQPAPFHAPSTTYVITVSTGPSTAIRQMITTVGDGDENNRTGNVVFPMVVQLDYVSIETVATSSEIAEMVIPLDSGFAGTTPTGAQVTLRGYNLNGTTIPTDIVNGIVVGVSLDGGSTWNTKPLRINSTAIHGQTLATSFGVQTFAGASDLSVPWVTVPAGIAVGDYLVLNSGPNQGRYVITGLTNDTNVAGPRLYLDRPFPVPGSATLVTWYCTNAKDDYEGDGTIPNLGFGSFGMNFDLTGMTVSGGNLHVRIEFKDGVTGHDVTYEIDSFSVQWSP